MIDVGEQTCCIGLVLCGGFFYKPLTYNKLYGMQIDFYTCQHCKQNTIRCTDEDGIIDEECSQCGGSIWTEPTTNNCNNDDPTNVSA